MVVLPRGQHAVALQLEPFRSCNAVGKGRVVTQLSLLRVGEHGVLQPLGVAVEAAAVHCQLLCFQQCRLLKKVVELIHALSLQAVQHRVVSTWISITNLNSSGGNALTDSDKIIYGCTFETKATTPQSCRYYILCYFSCRFVVFLDTGRCLCPRLFCHSLSRGSLLPKIQYTAAACNITDQLSRGPALLMDEIVVVLENKSSSISDSVQNAAIHQK